MTSTHAASTKLTARRSKRNEAILAPRPEARTTGPAQQTRQQAGIHTLAPDGDAKDVRGVTAQQVELLRGPPDSFAPVDNTVDTVDDLYEKLGISFSKADKVYENFLERNDPLIKSQFMYELGNAKPIIKDRFSSGLPFCANYLHAPDMGVGLLFS